MLIKGLNPISTFDFLGMSGSSLSGVKNNTNKISSGQSEYTTVGAHT